MDANGALSPLKGCSGMFIQNFISSPIEKPRIYNDYLKAGFQRDNVTLAEPHLQSNGDTDLSRMQLKTGEP